MKALRAPIIAAAALSLLSCVRVTCSQVDPLVKVFPEMTAFPAAPQMQYAAGGMNVEFQFALYSNSPAKNFRISCSEFRSDEGNKIPAPVCGLVDYVGCSELQQYPAHDALRSNSGLFPDPILEQDSYDLPAFRAFCPWITLRVPEGTPAGIYTATVTMKGRGFCFREPVKVKVYPFDMEKPSFENVNWVFDFPEVLTYWNNGEKVELDSDLYWEYMDQLAEKMYEGHQTMSMVNIFRVVGMERGSDGKWTFDWTLFDKQVRGYIAHGVGERIQGAELGHRLNPVWESPMGLFYPMGGDEIELLPVSDPRVQEFYSQFLPAYKAHVEQNGWADRWGQKVCDEPIDANAESYCEVVRFIRRYWKDIQVLEALQTTRLTGAVDIWVPQLNIWHNNYDFYKERQKAGDHIWFYTCCFPQEEYPNRFIEQPLLKGRMVYWMGYKYGAEGFLHWGFNYWNADCYKDASKWSGSLVLPGGDSWIVYPGYHKFLRSIRFEQMRDGLEDITLLKMLERKDVGKARAICDGLVTNWWVYCTSPTRYMETRKFLLESLSE